MAKKVKSQAKPKAKPKEQPEKLLAKVPEEYVFWCCDGRIFRDMKELAEGLAAMSDEIFARHANPEKNDFSNWLRDVIKDEKLARDLENVLDRNEAARTVATRITIITKMSA
jgi:hypothetical protein